METAKAISKEVHDLFEQVKTQAKQYSDAFALLQSVLNAIQRNSEFIELQKSELVSLKSNLINEKNEFVFELNNSIESTIEEFKELTSKNHKIYIKLESVEQLIEELQDIRSHLQKGLIDIGSATDNFNAKSTIELDSFLREIRHNVEDGFEKESQKLDLKITSKLRKIDNRLLSFDQKMIQLSEGFSKDIKNLSNDLDSLKVKINHALDYSNQLRKELISNSESINLTIFNKINELDVVLDSLSQNGFESAMNANNLISTEIDTKFGLYESKLSNRIIEFDEVLSKLNSSQSTQEKRLKVLTIINLIAVAALIGLMLFSYL